MGRFFLILIFIGLNLLYSTENLHIPESSLVNDESNQINVKKGNIESKNRLLITPYLNNHLLIANDALGYSPELNIFLSLEELLKIPITAGLSVKYGLSSISNMNINFITFGVAAKYNIFTIKEFNIDTGIIPTINFSYGEAAQLNVFRVYALGVDISINIYAFYRLMKNLQIGLRGGYNFHYYGVVPYTFINVGLTIGYDIEL